MFFDDHQFVHVIPTHYCNPKRLKELRANFKALYFKVRVQRFQGSISTISKLDFNEFQAQFQPVNELETCSNGSRARFQRDFNEPADVQLA
ncbi:unnamed protein product [Polarella glacialis]|uniref:Uncharacterized protein n=1 Tax=Polarella glacialis TaxID=89957 RepID=A0A813KR39_POLGL|nr:unnamed protein product [Polarella glacialis]